METLKTLAMLMKKQEYINLTVVGSPTISDGVVSDFSGSNYVVANNALPTTVGNRYVFIGSATATAIPTTQYIFSFFCNTNTSHTLFGFGFRANGKFIIVATNGSNNIIYESSITYQINTKYQYKVETDLNTYIRLYINNNLVISENLSYTNIYSYNGNIYYGCFAYNNTLQLTDGNIDFNNSYIKINGTKYIFTLPQS